MTEKQRQRFERKWAHLVPRLAELSGAVSITKISKVEGMPSDVTLGRIIKHFNLPQRSPKLRSLHSPAPKQDKSTRGKRMTGMDYTPSTMAGMLLTRQWVSSSLNLQSSMYQ